MAIDFKPLREYFMFGIIKKKALEHKVDIGRAHDLINGRIKNPRKTDMGFIHAMIDHAKERMQLIDPVNERIKS